MRAAEAGYPEIRTVKDFEKVIQDYITKHPTDENGNKNIGLSLNADDWHMYQVTNLGFQTTGGPDDGEYYIDQETHQATYHFRRPEEKEFLRWLNHMNAIGLLDPESFVQKTDQFKAKVASGRVLGLADPEWDYGDGIKDSTGNYYTRNYPELLTANYSAAEKETLKAYNAEHWKDLFPKEEEFQPRAYGAAYTMSLPNDDPAVILGAKMKDITWKRIPEAVMSKPEDFDNIWDAYMAELEKAGVKEMEEAYTKHIKDRIELWSTK